MMAIDWTLTFITAIVALALVLLFFIERKYPKPEKKPDPVLKSLLLTILLIFVTLACVFFGVWTKDEVKKNAWLFFVFFIGLLIIFTLVAMKKRPLSPRVLKRKAEEYVDYFYRAEKILEDSNYYDVDGLTTDEEVQLPDDSIKKGKWSCLCWRKVNNHNIKFYVSMNIYTGYLLKLAATPSVHLVDSVMHNTAPVPKDGFLEEFNVEEEA